MDARLRHSVQWQSCAVVGRVPRLGRARGKLPSRAHEARCRQPTCALPGDGEPGSLEQFVTSNGGRVSDSVRLQYTDHESGRSREMVAVKDLVPGERLLEVPAGCQVRYNDASDARLVALMDGAPRTRDRVAWQFRMALNLLHHRLAGPASPLAPYIAQLPGVAAGVAAPHVAMVWSPEELAELQSPGLAEDAASQAYWWRHFSAELAQLPGSAADPFGGQRVTEELLGWALSMAMSRSFALKRTDGHSMVPLVDMLNHSPESNCEIRSQEDGSVAMIANKPVRAGASLLLKYNSHDNASLLLAYGFLVPGNSHDAVVRPLDMNAVMGALNQFVGGGEPAARPIDMLRQWQRTKLAELGLLPAQSQQQGAAAGAAPPTALPPFEACIGCAGAPVQGPLLAACRVALSEDRKAIEPLTLEQLGDWGSPLAPLHEAVVMRGLVGVCTALYQAFPTTIQRDRALLAEAQAASDAAVVGPAGGLAERRLLAIQYRLGQKQVLEAAAKQLLVRAKELAAEAGAGASAGAGKQP